MAKPHIAVIGGGLMGVGIAQTFAAFGYPTTVFEPIQSVRAGIRDRVAENLTMIGADASPAQAIAVTDDLKQAVANAYYVTEAVPERLELKRAIFSDLVKLAPRDAILASNTSAIPITQIARGLETADRIVGTHWWNPAYLVPLVEVVQAERTSAETIDAAMRLLRAIGKAPAHVRKDLPGFVGNRLQHALWREAIAMVAEGVCDAATLDACVKNSFGMRLPVLGPLENADLVGLDLTLDIHRTLIPELDRHDGPHEYLQAKVSEGKLGFKTAEGFKTWTPDEMQALRTRLVEHLVKSQREREPLNEK
jgi:3-hydroxybutyryl-CoA dehydrogenase